jgi:hypothetical protein
MSILLVMPGRHADKYNKTTEAILSYIQTNYNKGQDMEDPEFDDWK